MAKSRGIRNAKETKFKQQFGTYTIGSVIQNQGKTDCVHITVESYLTLTERLTDKEIQSQFAKMKHNIKRLIYNKYIINNQTHQPIIVVVPNVPESIIFNKQQYIGFEIALYAKTKLGLNLDNPMYHQMAQDVLNILTNQQYFVAKIRNTPKVKNSALK
jgi:PHD/YefM family antitoxin component YafN of YafNO toxin-antitoxin module